MSNVNYICECVSVCVGKRIDAVLLYVVYLCHFEQTVLKF